MNKIPAPVIKTDTVVDEPTAYSAEDYASDNWLASNYIELREEEARKFVKSLVWKSQDDDMRFVNCIYADVYGVRIVHDLSGKTLGAGTCWGEMFHRVAGELETTRFEKFENFVAYMLAKFW